MAVFLATSVVEQLTSLAGGMVTDYLFERIKSVMSTTKDLEKMRGIIEDISAVLQDAENQASSNNNERIKIWLRDLKSIFYDIDDLFDEVAYHAKANNEGDCCISNFCCCFVSEWNHIILRFRWSKKIKELGEKVQGIEDNRQHFGLTENPVDHSSSRDEVNRNTWDACDFVSLSSIIGRREATRHIINQISAVCDARELSVLPIVGIGGVGKTALAKLVRDEVPHFNLKLWVHVSGTYTIPSIAESILRSGKVHVNESHHMSTLVPKLHALLRNKKYFIVLDDVWVDNISLWNDIKYLLVTGKPGSVALITTRTQHVASICQANMEPYYLERLSDDASWSIFKGLAFPRHDEENYPELCEIGQSIVEKCCGIPLVVKTLGSLLRNQLSYQLRYQECVREWQRIRDLDCFVGLEQYDADVIPSLKVSYDKLPPDLKSCFAHFAIFPKGGFLLNTSMTYYWSALGLIKVREEDINIEDAGRSYFMQLLSRSLVDEFSLAITGEYMGFIHDHLHDLAMAILGEELTVITSDRMNVSEFNRHINWGYEKSGSLRNIQFPTDLHKASKARTFRFNHDVEHISRSIIEGIISHFPCLRILAFGPNKFDELPESIGNLIHLRQLILSGNDCITTLPQTMCKLLNLEVLNIENCEKLTEIPKGVFQLQSLRYFKVTTCQKSLEYNKPNNLSSLNFLELESCKDLVSLWDNEHVGGLKNLEIFNIFNCPKLGYLPRSTMFLTKLQVLCIINCEELDLGQGEWMQGLESLRKLSLHELPKLETIPDGIQSAAGSLESLTLIDCIGLLNLPDCLEQFTSLNELEIEGCPHLTQSCAKNYGRDYHLVQHIKSVILDGADIKNVIVFPS